MELTEETIKKLQEIKLKMLEMFVHICEEEDLLYYVLGSTLLGAVCYKGFIPWDDKISVGMPRGDYEKFISCAPTYLPQDYFLQTYKTDKEYPYPYAKIRDSRTIYKEEALKNLKINHGVYINIFPLDFYPVFSSWFNFKFRLLEKRINSRLVIKTNLKDKVLQLFSYVFYPSWHKAVKQRDELMCMCAKNLSLITNFCSAYGNKATMPSEWFKEGETLDFEHLIVRVPAQYQKYLSQIYGDYKAFNKS